MAPRLPDRYQTHVRLGTDGDVEEWLATDTSLDRPVLVRVLDVAASPERRDEFLGSVRSAAAAHHSNLVEVYAVGDDTQPYAVTEWYGGVTVADRIHAGRPLPVDEFLPNAVGLASGLAALHAAGAVHGAIDTSAVGYASEQPAKLGGYGRTARVQPSAAGDTKDLAATLRMTIVGEHGNGVGPSQVAAGIPPAVDGVLAQAEAGRLSATALETALRDVPPGSPPRGMRWSWGWIGLVIVIIVFGLVVSAIGIAVDFDEDDPILFPAAPPTTGPQDATTAPPTTTAAPSSDELTATAAVFDPYGDQSERDEELSLLADADPTTGWRTERYFRPLPEVKPGVGAMFSLVDDPAGVVVQGTPGIVYEWKWADQPTNDITSWEHVGRGTLLAGQNPFQLPPRTGGSWLLWITDLPETPEGEYIGEITVVRFVS